MRLPKVLSSKNPKQTQTQFGGINATKSAQNGDIRDMQNMSSDNYPLLSPRKPRFTYDVLNEPNGLYAHNGLYWVDGDGFYANGVLKGRVSNSPKTFASLGDYIIVLPDKVVYDSYDGTFSTMDKEVSVSATFEDGTYVGEATEGNTIKATSSSFDWAQYFKVGDAIEVSGSNKPENNKSNIIREIAGNELRFYELNWTVDNSPATITVKRSSPEMDYICENENRLWACKGDNIYASKQGDPFNWNVMDGTAADSWANDTGSAGDFTGCVSYLGYPVFFKDQYIYKIYGEKPANFQYIRSANIGIAPGGNTSLAISGETLFYLGRSGIMAYSGGIPKCISQPLGNDKIRTAVSGSDGRKYYASIQDTEGNWRLYVYDTELNTWHIEDDTQAMAFAWDNGNLYCLDADGKLWMTGDALNPEGQKEGKITSVVEFADVDAGSLDRKHIIRERMRLEVAPGAKLQAYIQYDESGIWELLSTIYSMKKYTSTLSCAIRRCDHFKLKFVCDGDWTLYALEHEYYTGGVK